MARFEPDFTKVSANIRIFDRGDYLVKLGKARGFAYVNTDPANPRSKKMVAGVSYPATMVGPIDEDGSVEDTFRGEAVTPFKSYLHSENAYGMTKRFVMTAAGYGRDDEDDFNTEWLPEHSLSFHTWTMS